MVVYIVKNGKNAKKIDLNFFPKKIRGFQVPPKSPKKGQITNFQKLKLAQFVLFFNFELLSKYHKMFLSCVFWPFLKTCSKKARFWRIFQRAITQEPFGFFKNPFNQARGGHSFTILFFQPFFYLDPVFVNFNFCDFLKKVASLSLSLKPFRRKPEKTEKIRLENPLLTKKRHFFPTRTCLTTNGRETADFREMFYKIYILVLHLMSNILNFQTDLLKNMGDIRKTVKKLFFFSTTRTLTTD